VDLRAELVEWVEAQTGATVARVRRNYGGGSRVTWFVDGERAGQPLPLLVREESGAGAFSGSVLSLAREGTVYRALRDTPVRIPRLHAATEDGQALLIERVDGTADLGRLSHGDRHAVLLDFVDALAELHAVDVDTLSLDGFTRPVGAAEHALAEVELWSALAREVGGPAEPEIVYALAWLSAHPPATVDHTVLVQGDTGPGNFVAADGHVSALVDWEFAHIGDPMDDLAWVEYRLRRTPDAPSFEMLVSRYASRTGRAVDRDAIAYYAVLVQVRCAITTARTIARGGGAVGLTGYLVAHRRFLEGITAALARAVGAPPAPAPQLDATPTTETPWYDRALDDLEAGVLPALQDPAVKLRARSAATLLRHFRALDRIGEPVAEAEGTELERLLGPGPHDPDGEPLRRVAAEAGARGDPDLLGYLTRRAARNVALWPDA
jgi:aminoglycoside phosphotransferase (APT) family kinase protein